jgi:hypothetical protein
MDGFLRRDMKAQRQVRVRATHEEMSKQACI